MTVMRFTKMHGIGNDYVYVSCFTEPEPKDPAALSIRISDRHTGRGQPSAVTRKRNGKNRTGLALERNEFNAPSTGIAQVPNPHRTILTPGRQMGTIGRKCHGADHSHARFSHQQGDGAGADVPNSHRLVLASRSELRAVGGKGH